MFSCKICNKVYKSKDSLVRHTKHSCNLNSKLLCEYCGKLYSSLTLIRHLLTIHNIKTNIKNKSSIKMSHQTIKRLKLINNDLIFCNPCGINVKKSLFNSHLKTNEHKSKSCVECESNISVIKTAFKNRIISFKIDNDNLKMDIVTFLEHIKDKVCEIIMKQVEIYHSIKTNIELFCTYVLPTRGDREIKSFNTKFQEITLSSNVPTIYNSFSSRINTRSEEFQVNIF